MTMQLQPQHRALIKRLSHGGAAYVPRPGRTTPSVELFTVGTYSFVAETFHLR